MKAMLDLVMEFTRQHKFWIGAVSLAMFLASVVLVPVFVQILPADYFR